MSTTTALTPDTRGDHERSLARDLGLVRGTLPPLRLPPLAQRIVPGRSPLEASGWAAAGEDLPA